MSHPHPPSRSTDTPDPGDRTQTLDTPRRGSSDGAATPAPARGTPTWGEADPPPPAQLPVDDPDRYSLVGEHARGGLGRVVRAVDTRLGRTVAVKELLKKGETAESLFVREALITARLQHPGIVPVLEAGRWPSGEPYYVMKLVEGRTLKDAIGDRKTLEARLALLPSVIAVAEAIGYAHRQDVIHRDVKPANVVLGEFGETVVVDWGLARDGRRAPAGEADGVDDALAAAPGSGSQGTETVSGRVIGTPQYMAPEQARGEPVDARADVYSLGALLYEVLAGVAPFTGGNADTVLQKVIAGPPRPLAELQPDVPPDLLAIVDKAMARAPADRYPNAKELAEDLKRFQTGQLVTAHRYGAMALIRRWIARNRGPVAVAAIAAVIVVLAGIGMVRRIVEERNVAQSERLAADDARRAAEERSNALRALQAESSVRRDPTAAVAWLKQLQIDDDSVGAAATLLDEALAAGVAKHVFREADWIYGVAFSPDGRWLATASKDGGVTIYDVATGATRALGEHDGGVMAVAFVDGGRALVTGGLDGRILAWPTAGGAPRAIAALDGAVKAMELTPAGVLVVATEEDAFGAWQMPAGEALFVINKRDRLPGVIAGDLSPADPAKWLIGYADGRLELLDHGERVATLPKLSRTPRLLELSPDGRSAAIYDGAEVHVVDVAASRLRTLGPLTGPIRFLTWSPDGATVAVGGEVPDLYLFHAGAEPGAPRVLRGHTDSIYGVQWTRDGRRLLSASDDATARVWDLDTGNVEVLGGHDDDVYSAAFSPDETMVATASLDDSARVWHVGASGVRVLGGDLGSVLGITAIDDHELVVTSSPLQVTRWDLHTGDAAVVVPQENAYRVMLPAISPRGDVAYAPGPDHAIQVVLADGARRRLEGHTGKVVGGAFSADGAALFSASHDGTLRRWDLATGEGTVVIRGEPIESIEMAPSGDRWVIGLAERFVVHATDGREIASQRVADIGISPAWCKRHWSEDGRRLVLFGKNGRAVYWEPDAGTVVPLESTGHHATNLTFSPDGHTLAGAMADRSVLLWDLRTGRIDRALHGHVDLVMNVAYSPDGRLLASTSYDRTVRLWDVATGQARVLRGHRGAVETLVWLDGGARLVTGSRDGTLRVWTIPSTRAPTPDELRLQIERATTAVIGPGERLATPAPGP